MGKDLHCSLEQGWCGTFDYHPISSKLLLLARPGHLDGGSRIDSRRLSQRNVLARILTPKARLMLDRNSVKGFE